MKFAIVALATTAIALAGCVDDTVGGPGASTYYDCGNGTRLKVDAIPDDMIQVQMNNDEPVRIPAVAAASGAKYTNARHTFWSKGDEATWIVGRMAPMTCKQVTMPRVM